MCMDIHVVAGADWQWTVTSRDGFECSGYHTLRADVATTARRWLLYLWLWNVCVWSITLNCDLLDSAYTAQPQWLHVYECWELILLQCTTCTGRHHSVCAANCIPPISDFTWAPQYFHRAPNFSAFMGLQIYTLTTGCNPREGEGRTMYGIFFFLMCFWVVLSCTVRSLYKKPIKPIKPKTPKKLSLKNLVFFPALLGLHTIVSHGSQLHWSQFPPSYVVPNGWRPQAVYVLAMVIIMFRNGRN